MDSRWQICSWESYSIFFTAKCALCNQMIQRFSFFKNVDLNLYFQALFNSLVVAPNDKQYAEPLSYRNMWIVEGADSLTNRTWYLPEEDEKSRMPNEPVSNNRIKKYCGPEKMNPHDKEKYFLTQVSKAFASCRFFFMELI